MAHTLKLVNYLWTFHLTYFEPWLTMSNWNHGKRNHWWRWLSCFFSKCRFGCIFLCIDWGKVDRRKKVSFPLCYFNFVSFVLCVIKNICLLVSTCGQYHTNNWKKALEGRKASSVIPRHQPLRESPASKLTGAGSDLQWPWASSCAHSERLQGIIFEPLYLRGYAGSHLPVGLCSV